ncbi:MAG: phage tail assembly chaperone [Proteobacteria bacterium]|nr:phage tail assembly chaperone [Pseudomonadota bacterium]
MTRHCGSHRVIVPGPDDKPIAADPLPPTGDELAAAIRTDRNARLSASDWTQLPDAQLTAEAKAAWAAYRQALRDITEQAGFPQVVGWPEQRGG